MANKGKIAPAFFFLLLLGLSCCRAQIEKPLGGPCEGCEALLEYGDRKLLATDTLPEFDGNEPKLKISGTVFKKDKRTPAGNVIVYIYHTNGKGVYEKKGDEKGWAKRHGYIRGWIKTGKDGRYTFYTFRPAAYPDRSEPQHIHITVKEPGKKEYYLDDFLFLDDPGLTPQIRENLKNRGGSGVVSPKMAHGILTVERDLIMGLNIPNYP